MKINDEKCPPISNCGNATNKKITYNGLGLVGGDGVGYNFRSDNLVMFHLLAVLFEGSVAEGGHRGHFLDEPLGRDFVADEGLVLEGLDVLPLLDGDGRAGQLDGLGGRLDHGVGVGVVAAVVRGHGCDGFRRGKGTPQRKEWSWLWFDSVLEM